MEGINTTEGTGGAGFYFDYGSLEEVFLGTAGQGAEMPNPGVQSQFLGKSGGNRFQGEIYSDYENKSLQGSNIPAEWTAATAFNRNPIRAGSNEIEGYRDFKSECGRADQARQDLVVRTACTWKPGTATSATTSR